MAQRSSKRRSKTRLKFDENTELVTLLDVTESNLTYSFTSKNFTESGFSIEQGAVIATKVGANLALVEAYNSLNEVPHRRADYRPRIPLSRINASMSNITALTISSGSVAYCGRRNQIILDNVLNGFDLYELVKGKARRLHNFRTRVSTVPLPKQVTFCEDDKIVIAGSDDGTTRSIDDQDKISTNCPRSWRYGSAISVRRVAQLLAESNKLTTQDFTTSGARG